MLGHPQTQRRLSVRRPRTAICASSKHQEVSAWSTGPQMIQMERPLAMAPSTTTPTSHILGSRMDLHCNPFHLFSSLTYSDQLQHFTLRVRRVHLPTSNIRLRRRSNYDDGLSLRKEDNRLLIQISSIRYTFQPGPKMRRECSR